MIFRSFISKKPTYQWSFQFPCSPQIIINHLFHDNIKTFNFPIPKNPQLLLPFLCQKRKTLPWKGDRQVAPPERRRRPSTTRKEEEKAKQHHPKEGGRGRQHQKEEAKQYRPKLLSSLAPHQQNKSDFLFFFFEHLKNEKSNYNLKFFLTKKS